MFRSLPVVAALLVAAFSTTQAGAQKETGKKFDDAEFVKMAASGGMAEVELGNIGNQRAKSSEVKAFSARLVKDHSHANEELKAVAKAAGITVPSKISEKHQKHIDMFKNYSGADFDRDFIKHMVQDHENDIAHFTAASKEAKSADLRAFASKTLPVLKEHLEMAKKLENK